MPARLAALPRPSGLIVLAGGTYDQQISHRELQALAPRTPRHIRDITRPFRLYFRRKRMRNFLRWMAVSDRMTIVDVGGTPFVWHLTDCSFGI